MAGLKSYRDSSGVIRSGTRPTTTISKPVTTITVSDKEYTRLSNINSSGGSISKGTINQSEIISSTTKSADQPTTPPPLPTIPTTITQKPSLQDKLTSGQLTNSTIKLNTVNKFGANQINNLQKQGYTIDEINVMATGIKNTGKTDPFIDRFLSKPITDEIKQYTLKGEAINKQGENIQQKTQNLENQYNQFNQAYGEKELSQQQYTQAIRQQKILEQQKQALEKEIQQYNFRSNIYSIIDSNKLDLKIQEFNKKQTEFQTTQQINTNILANVNQTIPRLEIKNELDARTPSLDKTQGALPVDIIASIQPRPLDARQTTIETTPLSDTLGIRTKLGDTIQEKKDIIDYQKTDIATNLTPQ